MAKVTNRWPKEPNNLSICEKKSQVNKIATNKITNIHTHTILRLFVGKGKGNRSV